MRREWSRVVRVLSATETIGGNMGLVKRMGKGYTFFFWPALEDTNRFDFEVDKQKNDVVKVSEDDELKLTEYVVKKCCLTLLPEKDSKKIKEKTCGSGHSQVGAVLPLHQRRKVTAKLGLFSVLSPTFLYCFFCPLRFAGQIGCDSSVSGKLS